MGWIESTRYIKQAVCSMCFYSEGSQPSGNLMYCEGFNRDKKLKTFSAMSVLLHWCIFMAGTLTCSIFFSNPVLIIKEDKLWEGQKTAFNALLRCKFLVVARAGVQTFEKGSAKKKRDQIRSLMHTSFFSLLLCHSKHTRNKEFRREIPLCLRLPSLWLNALRCVLPPLHGSQNSRFPIYHFRHHKRYYISSVQLLTLMQRLLCYANDQNRSKSTSLHWHRRIGWLPFKREGLNKRPVLLQEASCKLRQGFGSFKSVWWTKMTAIPFFAPQFRHPQGDSGMTLRADVKVFCFCFFSKSLWHFFSQNYFQLGDGIHQDQHVRRFSLWEDCLTRVQLLQQKRQQLLLFYSRASPAASLAMWKSPKRGCTRWKRCVLKHAAQWNLFCRATKAQPWNLPDDFRLVWWESCALWQKCVTFLITNFPRPGNRPAAQCMFVISLAFPIRSPLRPLVAKRALSAGTPGELEENVLEGMLWCRVLAQCSLSNTRLWRCLL